MINELDLELDRGETSEELEELSSAQKKISSQSCDERVDSLYADWKEGNLLIQPEFQRHYVWDPQKATSLMESALMKVPLPIVYLAEEPNGKKSVIDGQQRLTAFFSFIDGKFPDQSEFKLRKMQIFHDLKGKCFAELEKEQQLCIKKCPIRTITFDNTCNPELKFNVFERLNTGSVSLNDQELRNCMFRGKYNDLLKELAANPDFKSILGIEDNERRMLDVELVLRFCAFLNQTYLNYKPPMKNFLNDEMRNNRDLSLEKAEKIRSCFKNAVALVKSMRGRRAFRRFLVGTECEHSGMWEPRKFNVSLYDILMYGFAERDKNLVMRNLDAINEAFIDLMSCNEEFCESIERSTSSRQAVTKRFDVWRTTLDGILNDDAKQPRCFSKDFKKRLYAQDPKCAICGQEIASVDDAAIDHIEQYWRGGKTIPDNARLTHRYCNSHRSLID